MDRVDVPPCLNCVEPPSTEVDLKVGPSGFASNMSPPPCFRGMASGFLGDASPATQANQAGFRFVGTAGEPVTVTLERDGVKSCSGDTAQLILRDEQGNVLEQGEGKLPVKITAALPALGNYVVQAIQSAGSETEAGTPFRGDTIICS